MQSEVTPLKIVNELVVLKKFASDDQTQEPIEVITLENGVVISHEVR